MPAIDQVHRLRGISGVMADQMRRGCNIGERKVSKVQQAVAQWRNFRSGSGATLNHNQASQSTVHLLADQPMQVRVLPIEPT